MKVMHKISEREINVITRPTVLFSHTDEIKIPELANAKTDPPENYQDNGATPPVNTQLSTPHSPLEDASLASSASPPRPRVKAGNAALQAREGDLQDVCLLGDD